MITITALRFDSCHMVPPVLEIGCGVLTLESDPFVMIGSLSVRQRYNILQRTEARWRGMAPRSATYLKKHQTARLAIHARASVDIDVMCTPAAPYFLLQ